MPDRNLYFAYGSLLDPERMKVAAPGARFLFTAHYPETRLSFATSPRGDSIPTLTKDSGHTVWGGVFEIPEDEIESLTSAEKEEGRSPGFDMKAVDREGNKHDCLTFVANGDTVEGGTLSRDYLDAMVSGARHWQLPAGWVMGLEDLSEDSLF